MYICNILHRQCVGMLGEEKTKKKRERVREGGRKGEEVREKPEPTRALTNNSTCDTCITPSGSDDAYIYAHYGQSGCRMHSLIT